jgi:hypothetical protein
MKQYVKLTAISFLLSATAWDLPVIAHDQRERGNLIIYKPFWDCFRRFTPSQ